MRVLAVFARESEFTQPSISLLDKFCRILLNNPVEYSISQESSSSHRSAHKSVRPFNRNDQLAFSKFQLRVKNGGLTDCVVSAVCISFRFSFSTVNVNGLSRLIPREIEIPRLFIEPIAVSVSELPNRVTRQLLLFSTLTRLNVPTLTFP